MKDNHYVFLLNKERESKDFDILNLGSGNKPMDDAINMDLLYEGYKINFNEKTNCVSIQVNGDFNKKIPFSDEKFKRIYMSHSLEHCKDIWFTIKEVHRLLEVGEKAFIRVPYWRWPSVFSPLHHNYYFNLHSMDPLDRDYHLFSVKKTIKFYTEKKIWKILTWPLQTVVNWFPNIYEISFLSVLVPAPEILYELTKR